MRPFSHEYSPLEDVRQVATFRGISSSWSNDDILQRSNGSTPDQFQHRPTGSCRWPLRLLIPDMEKEVLEVALKNSARQSNIQSILEVKTESALPKGENYGSIVLRIQLRVVLGNGRLAKKNLIMKKSLQFVNCDNLPQGYNLYKTEAMMYSVIIKEMEILMEEFEDHEDPLWCKFIYYEPLPPAIILEDLKDSGFRLVPRQIGLDFEHAMLVLRNLGRYHAMTKVLEVRGVISKDSYKPHPLIGDSYCMKIFSYGGIQSTAKGIRKYWGPDWTTLAEKLSVPLEVFMRKTNNSSKPEEGMFSCLNHGDCWSNNILFKYDWQNRPVSVRFIDYQVPHYNTPCIDVTNFLYLSIQPKVRRQNYKLFIKCYHESLTTTLDKYGYTGPKPSLEEIEKVMERLSFIGLSYFTSSYPTVTSKSTEAFDLEKAFKTGGEEGHNLGIYKEEGMKERLLEDVIDFSERLSAT